MLGDLGHFSFLHHRRKISSCHYVSAEDQVTTASGLGVRSRCLGCGWVLLSLRIGRKTA